MTEKLGLIIFLVVFWLVLPIILSFTPLANSNNDIDSPNYTGNFFTDSSNFVSTYIQLLFFTVPTISPIIGRILNIVQLISAVVIFLLLRGD